MRSLVLAYAAAHDLGFALFHLGFARIFGWREAFAGTDDVNRGVVHVLNHALTFLFAAAGLLILWIWLADIRDATAVRLIAGLGAFWIFRAALQPVYWGLVNAISLALFAALIVGAGAHLAAALLI